MLVAESKLQVCLNAELVCFIASQQLAGATVSRRKEVRGKFPEVCGNAIKNEVYFGVKSVEIHPEFVHWWHFPKLLKDSFVCISHALSKIQAD